jgi:hypothetical protein
MNTLQWRHTDWTGRNFIFWLNEKVIGELTFKSSWDLNAVYQSQQAQLKFIVTGFWKNRILIMRGNEKLGEIKNGFSGKQTLTLVNGKSYVLTSGFWGRSAQWSNLNGEILIKYTTASIRSMGKGTIIVSHNLAADEKELLVSTGLFARQMLLKMAVMVLIIMIPAMSAASRT